MQSLSEASSSVDLDACGMRVLDCLPPVIWFIRREMRQHRGGLSMAQFRALVRVNHEKNISLSALADHLGSSLPTASRIVTGLVDKRLLERQGCAADRRQLSLRMTRQGRAILKSARAATRRSIAGELRPLSNRQRQQICVAMDHLSEIFGSVSLFEKSDAAPAATNGKHNNKRRRTAK